MKLRNFQKAVSEHRTQLIRTPENAMEFYLIFPGKTCDFWLPIY